MGGYQLVSRLAHRGVAERDISVPSGGGDCEVEGGKVVALIEREEGPGE